MRLFKVELRRAFARRLTIILAIVALAGIVLAFGVTLARSHGGVSAASQQIERACMSIPSNAGAPGSPGQPQVPSVPGEPGSQERADYCRQFERASGSYFDLTELKGRLTASAALAGVMMLLLGASLIGAEWRAGSVITQLTWEPRRVRLILTKVLVAIILGMIFYVVAQALYGGLLWLVAATRGSTATTPGFAREIAGTFGRGAAFVALMTVFGFALGNIGRNTAAAVGIGFFYTAILENIVRAAWHGIEPWLFGINAIELISGERLNLGEGGVMTGHTALAAGLTLCMWVGIPYLISLVLFTGRDIT